MCLFQTVMRRQMRWKRKKNKIWEEDDFEVEPVIVGAQALIVQQIGDEHGTIGGGGGENTNRPHEANTCLFCYWVYYECYHFYHCDGCSYEGWECWVRNAGDQGHSSSKSKSSFEKKNFFHWGSWNCLSIFLFFFFCTIHEQCKSDTWIYFILFFFTSTEYFFQFFIFFLLLITFLFEIFLKNMTQVMILFFF